MNERKSENLFDQAVAYLRLERSRRRWRLLAVVALILLAAAVTSFGEHGAKRPASYVAQVQINGMIGQDLDQEKLFDKIANDKKAKALLVYIDSPGGTVVGGLSLFDSLRQVAAHKPVVAVMGTVAASAAYLTSLGADYVIANPATLTGSVGVILPLIDATGLAGRLGVQSDEIASGSKKAITSPLYVRSVADRELLKSTVMDMQKIFLAKVKERRGVDSATLQTVSDGRMLTGQQAAEMHLVDALGNTHTARAWLAQKHKISVDMPVLDMTESAPHGVLSELLQQLNGMVFPSVRYQGMLSVVNP